MRVPMIVVSPWSKGGWVNSQVFDHTSVIRFIEARFGAGNSDMIEANITPWRRAVAGDLTSAFNFATPNARSVQLPSTVGFAPPDRTWHDDLGVVPPTQQAVPAQELGVRPARALPYTLHAHGTVNTTDGSVRIDFENSGSAAAVFQVRSGNQVDAPRTYTVGPNNKLSGSWNVAAATSEYHLSVHGPNGFFRGFNGTSGPGRANLKVRASYDTARNSISLTIVNSASHAANVRILDKYAGSRTGRLLSAGETLSRRWSLDDSHGWYELLITVDGDPSFESHLAGHVETGRPSSSDPAMGGVVNH
jgi:phospholipase C